MVLQRSIQDIRNNANVWFYMSHPRIGASVRHLSTLQTTLMMSQTEQINSLKLKHSDEDHDALFHNYENLRQKELLSSYKNIFLLTFRNEKCT